MNLFGFKKRADIAPEEVEQHTQVQGAAQTPKYINEAEIDKATTTLREYMKGKANLDARIIEDEQWYKGQHWAAIRKKMSGNTVEPTSRWLFNTVMNKHADMMDNFPTQIIKEKYANQGYIWKGIFGILQCRDRDLEEDLYVNQ